MRNKIFKWTFWSEIGLMVISLVGGLSLIVAHPQTKINNLTPSPRNHSLAFSQQQVDKNNLENTSTAQPALNIKDGLLKGFSDLESVRKLPDGSINLVIPNSVKVIAKGAFSGKNDGSESITEAGGLKIRSVTIPSSVTKIGQEAFYACNNLTKVTFNEGLETIDKWAFDQCSLTELKLPSTLVSLNRGAFKYCSYLSEVILPENLKNLGTHTFENCYALQTINIPKGITSIGDSVFNDTSIRTLFIPSTIKCIGETGVQYIDYETHDFEAILLPDEVKLAAHPFVCATNDSIIKWSKNLFVWTTNANIKSELELKTVDDGSQLYYPGTVRVLKNKGDIYTRDDQEFAGLTARGRTATSLTIPSYVSSIPNFTFTECAANLKEITFESKNIKFDRYALHGLPQNVTYHVYSKEIGDKLAAMGVTGLIQVTTSLSPAIIAIVAAVVVVSAIIGLGAGIIIPIRKQNKINLLNSKLTNRRIDRLITSNAMAFKKVIEATGMLSKKIDQNRPLGPATNRPKKPSSQSPHSSR